LFRFQEKSGKIGKNDYIIFRAIVQAGETIMQNETPIRFPFEAPSVGRNDKSTQMKRRMKNAKN